MAELFSSLWPCFTNQNQEYGWGKALEVTAWFYSHATDGTFPSRLLQRADRGCVRQSASERNRAGHIEVAQQQNGLFCRSSRQTDVNGKESYGWDA